ncbi:RNA pseudouridine synthase [Anoxybacter fermentans]|uniref:Pseudouridine synthase n=1 Tax=Anoxybacter fermentans TaxID=1323375 RepID=A0A3S9SXF3_9FIRM|nr:RluA family pseudouridine synthase [Anoxybacter fermentans]AZR73013.1 RNA pseudouridine synthase [Anoxybacter fermentans]
MLEIREFDIASSDENMRLDKYLAEVNDDFSRSYIKQLIDEGRVKVNGRVEKASYKVKAGDEIVFEVPEATELEVKPEAIPLDIIYEDDDIVVINKPWDMVVHPAPGNESGTLVNALLYHCKNLSGINGIIRPGIVHRLDKDTSGVLVVAKTDMAHRILVEQFKRREIEKIYLALVKGFLPYDKGKIDAPIGRDPKDRKKMAVVKENSKPALTRFEVKQRFRDYTLVKVNLETGRTHQIRVHFRYIGYPVVGDDKYGYKESLPVKRQMLHAYQLTITHPRTGEKKTFTAPIPEDMEKILVELRKNNTIFP